MNSLRGIKCIESMYRTFQAAWIVYGIIGMRQYMGYSKTEAKEMYMSESRQKILIGRNTNGTINLIIT